MCGRYSITLPVEAVRRYFQVPQLPNLAPNYNLAPSQDAPVVRLDREGRRELFWALAMLDPSVCVTA